MISQLMDSLGRKMTPEIAQAAIQFLMRVQLSGQEVPAFNAVIHELSKFANATDERDK